MSTSTLLINAFKGVPLMDELVIDSHCHMGQYCNFNTYKCYAAGMVSRMDRLGIRACMPAHHASIGPDYRYGNEEVLQAMSDFPGRFYGYATVNPNYPKKEVVAEIERCIEAGMVGIKIHPCMHDSPVDGKEYAPVWEYANEHSIPLLSHTETGGNNAVLAFEKLAEMYPNVAILLAHSGFGSKGADHTIQAVSKHPNIYAEIAGSTVVYGTLERMVHNLGADRVLFGTDMPFLDPRPQLGRVAFAKITDDEKRLVFGLNAARIFGIGT